MSENEEPKTRVVLRRFTNELGGVIALFPDMRAGQGYCMSYMRTGQHGAASFDLIRDTVPARITDPDAAALVRELIAVGYRPRIVQRMPRR